MLGINRNVALVVVVEGKQQRCSGGGKGKQLKCGGGGAGGKGK